MKTTIALVLDRSGSMGGIQQETILGVNKFIRDQQALPGDCDFTLLQFSTGKPVFTNNGTPIKNVEPLTMDNYIIGGGTALLDAVGSCIDETGKRLADLKPTDRPERVIFCVVTDGEENSSHDYTTEQVAEKVKHQTEKYGWQFVFLGADIDTFAAAGKMNIKAAAAMPFNKQKVAAAYASLSANSRAYRGGETVSMDWSAAQRKDNS